MSPSPLISGRVRGGGVVVQHVEAAEALRRPPSPSPRPRARLATSAAWPTRAPAGGLDLRSRRASAPSPFRSATTTAAPSRASSERRRAADARRRARHDRDLAREPARCHPTTLARGTRGRTRGAVQDRLPGDRPRGARCATSGAGSMSRGRPCSSRARARGRRRAARRWSCASSTRRASAVSRAARGAAARLLRGACGRAPAPRRTLGRRSRDGVAALADAGLPLEAAGVDANGRSPAVFVFHRGAHGLRIELVDRAMQPGFEAWLAGGTLALP